MMADDAEYENEEGGIPDPDSYEGAPAPAQQEASDEALENQRRLREQGYGQSEDAELEAQIAAQEAGDAEAAKAAAVKAPEEAQTRPTPMLRDGFDIKIFRLANGEWVVGQFSMLQDDSGVAALAFYKVFRYQVGQNQQTGQMMVNMSPWPVEEGSLELTEITANGNPNAGTYGVNIGDAYLQFISPIQKANPQQANAAAIQANQKRARAQRIMEAGGRF